MIKVKKGIVFTMIFVMFSTVLFFMVKGGGTFGQAEELSEKEIIDEYLRDNGYSEEFIQQTGESTKQYLYEEQAVFESVSYSTISPFAANSGIWNSYNGSLTISDISTEDNYSKKVLTYDWHWNTAGADTVNVINDTVAIAWG